MEKRQTNSTNSKPLIIAIVMCCNCTFGAQMKLHWVVSHQIGFLRSHSFADEAGCIRFSLTTTVMISNIACHGFRCTFGHTNCIEWTDKNLVHLHRNWIEFIRIRNDDTNDCKSPYLPRFQFWRDGTRDMPEMDGLPFDSMAAPEVHRKLVACGRVRLYMKSLPIKVNLNSNK